MLTYLKNKFIRLSSDKFFERYQISFYDLFLAYFLFLFSYLIYFRMYSLQEDFALHYSLVLNKISEGKLFFPPSYNALMQWAIYLLGFSRNDLMFQAFPLLMSVTMVLKFFVIKMICVNYINENTIKAFSSSIISFGALMISVSFPIYSYFSLNSYWYRGLVPQCVWHNPTIITVMPFALMLFWYSYKFLLNKSKSNFVILLLLVIINFFTKPVFLLPLLPVFFICIMFFKFDDNRLSFNCSFKKLIRIIPFIFFAAIVALYLYNTLFTKFGIDFSLLRTLSYHNKSYDFIPNVKILMLKMFDINSTNSFVFFIFILLTLVFRVLLCNAFYFVSVFLVNKKTLLLNIYALAIWILGFAISISFKENVRAGAENFLWHLIVCNNMLMVVGLINFTTFLFEPQNKNNKFIFALCAFSAICLHAFCGILYIFRLIFKGTWL